MQQWPSATGAHHQPIRTNYPVPVPLHNRPLPLFFPPSFSPYQLLHRLNWSYFAIWSPADSTSASPRAQLIWKTGNYNHALISGNDPKLRHIASRMQQFQSSQQPIMAGRIAEKSMATISHQWATENDISGTLFKEGPIKNVLCIPLSDKSGVLELGTTDLVHDPSVLLAQIQKYLIGDDQNTTPITSPSSEYSPMANTALAHVPSMALNNTSVTSIESSSMMSELENSDVLKEILDNNIVLATLSDLSLPNIPPCSFDHTTSLYVETNQQNFGTYSHGGHHYSNLVNTLEGVRDPLPNLSQTSYSYGNIVSNNIMQNQDLNLLNYERRSPTSISTSIGQLNVTLEGQDSLNSQMIPQNEVISTLQQTSGLGNPIVNYMEGSNTSPYVGSNSSIPNVNPNEHSPATQHMIAERKRRKKQKDMFSTLKTMVPKINKRDKVTILESTINHLLELQSSVDNLEQQLNHFKSGTRTKMNIDSSLEPSDDVPIQPNCSVVYNENSTSTLKLSMRKTKRASNTNNNSVMIQIMECLTKLGLHCFDINFKSSKRDELDLTIFATYKEEHNHVELAEIEKHWRELYSTC